MENLLKALNRSPLFCLSLSSKELFHSNFLWWLGNNERTFPLFKQIMEKLTGQSLSWDYGSISVGREKKHFDLCVREGTTSRPLLILENKVKSIPGFRQLEDYQSEEPHADNYVLLTLITDFPKKDKVEEKGWKVCSYDDLYHAMEVVPIGPTAYELELINDYRTFIHSLQQLVQQWKGKVTVDKLFMQERNSEIEECRINDLYDKLRFCQLALMLQEQLNYTDVEVNTDYSNQSGILNVTIKCRGYELMIQIQGNSYRHACVWKDRKREECDSLWNFILKDDKVSSINYLSNSGANFGCDNLFTKGIYPMKHSQKGKLYNMFVGKNYLFLYQSRQLKKDVTIGQLIDNICCEVENICKEEEAETLER